VNGKRFVISAIAVIAMGSAIAACGGSSKPGTAPTVSQRATPAAATSSPSAEVIGKRMHLRGVVAYSATTDPNHLLGRQHGYTSKINWGPDLANSIEVFPTQAGALARGQYVAAFGPPIGDGYDFVVGTALIRLGSYLTQPQAAALNTAFKAAVNAP
jgi:hypothetical protein